MTIGIDPYPVPCCFYLGGRNHQKLPVIGGGRPELTGDVALRHRDPTRLTVTAGGEKNQQPPGAG